MAQKTPEKQKHTGKFGYYRVRETLWVHRWSCCFSENRLSDYCDKNPHGYRPFKKGHVWDRATQSYKTYLWEEAKVTGKTDDPPEVQEVPEGDAKGMADAMNAILDDPEALDPNVNNIFLRAPES